MIKWWTPSVGEKPPTDCRHCGEKGRHTPECDWRPQLPLSEIYGLTLERIKAATTDHLRAVLKRVIADSYADGYTGATWTEQNVRRELANRGIPSEFAPEKFIP